MSRLDTSDVQLNSGNGLDAIEEICREAPMPAIFIIGNPGDVRARLPHFKVLRKPFRAEGLEAALKHVGTGD